MKQLKAVPVATGTPVQIKPENIPDSAAYVFTQALYRAVGEAWKDPDFRARYEKWKQERANEKA